MSDATSSVEKAIVVSGSLPGRIGKMLPWNVKRHKYHGHIHFIVLGAWEYTFTPKFELWGINRAKDQDGRRIHKDGISFVEADGIVREHAAACLREDLELFEMLSQEERWIPADYEKVGAS